MKVRSYSAITEEDGCVHISLRVSKTKWVRISVDEVGVIDWLVDKEDNGSYEILQHDCGISSSELNIYLMNLLNNHPSK